MQGNFFGLIFLVICLLLIDAYVVNGLHGLPQKWRIIHKKSFNKNYWLFSVFLISCMLLVIFIRHGFGLRLIILSAFFFVVLVKVSFCCVLLIDDVRRLFIYLTSKIKQPTAESKPGTIPRSEFLVKAGLLAGAVPLAAIKINMASGLYDYQLKRQTLYLPNLPKAFDGLRIGQISDLHTGSLKNKIAAQGGIDMLMREKADVIFFTGDLVNNVASEMQGHMEMFGKVKAPLGVFSSLGNHDYGDYAKWLSPAARIQNNKDIITTHKNLGWDLLRNDNRRLKVNGEEIGILGCENWGVLHHYPNHGLMEPTVKNTDDLPVKLLLSHDPSHWRAQILPHYPQIDVMFSGHTHGMQCGIQTEKFQWSPIEYIYNEWAGHYQQDLQQLYVNVGYGFYFVTGRVGILPEITIFELKAAAAPLSKIS
jgi:predicted MPP superfamily phosphohydrolase